MFPDRHPAQTQAKRWDDLASSPKMAKDRVPLWQVIGGVLLLVLAWSYLEIHYAGELQGVVDGWKTGDWLINYQGGLVRRGLVGQLLFWLSSTGMNLRWLTFGLQSLVMFGVYLLAIYIFSLGPRHRVLFCMLLSPAFLLFPFFDLQGGFRKELLVLLSFGVLTVSYARKSMGVFGLAGAWIIYLLAVLSHELCALVLPFYWYLFYQAACVGVMRARSAVLAALLFSLTALFAIGFAFIFSGDDSAFQGICQSIQQRGFSASVCIGAIEWLKFDAMHGRQTVLNSLRFYYYYSILLALAILPVFLSDWPRGAAVLLMLASALAMLPLFTVAIDWGRWIYVYASMLFFLVLAEACVRRINFRAVPGWLLLLYLSIWSMPHCCELRPGFGWLELLIHLR